MLLATAYLTQVGHLEIQLPCGPHFSCAHPWVEEQ